MQVQPQDDEEEAKRARRRARDTNERGSELKPSEILALDQHDDVSSDSSDDDDDDDEEEQEENEEGQPIFKKREKLVFADGEYEDSVSCVLFVCDPSCPST